MTTVQETTYAVTEGTTTPAVKHWINGAETEGTTGRTQPIFNPSTGEVIGHVALGDVTTVDEAVRSATLAQKSWGRTSLAKRTTILFRMRELLLAHDLGLGEIISAEHGKTVDDARGEIARGRETIEFVCGINQASKSEFSSEASTGVDVHTLRQPLGVVAGITPFNFPAMVPLWMHPVAMAAGNAFILKPSERDPSATLLIAKLYQEAGLTGSSTWCTAARRLSTPFSRTKGSPRCPSSVPLRSPGTFSRRLSPTASAPRPSAGRTTMRSLCRMPTSPSRPRRSPPGPSVPPVNVVWHCRSPSSSAMRLSR
jgi:Aldehyde dehydrogenase family